jgi:hypothetical protein
LANPASTPLQPLRVKIRNRIDYCATDLCRGETSGSFSTRPEMVTFEVSQASGGTPALSF